MSEIKTSERITFKKLLQDLSDILNLKRGVPYTVLEIAKNPGKLINRYLSGERTTIVSSFRLLILLVSVSTFVSIQYGITELKFNETIGVNEEAENAQNLENDEIEPTLEFKRLLNQNLSMLQFLLVPFLGLFTYVFFRKSSLNLPEHITAQAYLMSFHAFILLLFTPLVFYSVRLYTIIPLLIFVIYHCWFCFSLQSTKSRSRVLLSGIGSVFLSYLLYTVLIVLSIGLNIFSE